mmetsp:Transcript_15219/g.53445  ORF Transcript_15219/g.53445 Transcript_15219/m.53445 type:complete len:258 (+) Transcript_15219:316-1089(+)
MTAMEQRHSQLRSHHRRWHHHRWGPAPAKTSSIQKGQPTGTAEMRERQRPRSPRQRPPLPPQGQAQASAQTSRQVGRPCLPSPTSRPTASGGRADGPPPLPPSPAPPPTPSRVNCNNLSTAHRRRHCDSIHLPLQPTTAELTRPLLRAILLQVDTINSALSCERPHICALPSRHTTTSNFKLHRHRAVVVGQCTSVHPKWLRVTALRWNMHRQHAAATARRRRGRPRRPMQAQSPHGSRSPFHRDRARLSRSTRTGR